MGSLSPSEPTKRTANCSIRSDGSDWRMLVRVRNDCCGRAREPKIPAASDVLYIKALAAPFTVNTIPDTTLLAFADHGTVGELMPGDGGNAEKMIAKFAQAGIDYDKLAADLQREGAESFVKSWKELLGSIASKDSTLKATG